ncbi:rna-directed dna polymerase from mobile element jockey-like [Limosa lapponica baueri]|uniref:Rna-directed dna polymerase from mobile element jockey-like n=1 Tax=Limosa lapponica baueri TaxID=1758121 RepID=A0A2I0TM78_LIMLA|nr:rna-directed dna polymerase from mobile element jockey-like [Limosa lapponica baueri]
MALVLGHKCILSTFADDTKPGGVAGTADGYAAIQRDLDRLEKWPARNLAKFSKGKYKLVHLRRENPRQQDRLMVNLLKSSFAEKALGVRVPSKVPMSQKCALVTKSADSLLGCIRQGIAIRTREVTLPLHAVLARHIWSAVPRPAMLTQWTQRLCLHD